MQKTNMNSTNKRTLDWAWNLDRSEDETNTVIGFATDNAGTKSEDAREKKMINGNYKDEELRDITHDIMSRDASIEHRLDLLVARAEHLKSAIADQFAISRQFKVDFSNRLDKLSEDAHNLKQQSDDYEFTVKDMRRSKQERFVERKNKDPVNVMEGVLNDIRRETFRKYEIVLRDVSFFDNDDSGDSNCYVCILSTSTVFRVSTSTFNERVSRYDNSKTKNTKPDSYVRTTRYGQKILYIVTKTMRMKPQVSFPILSNMFDKVVKSFTYVKDTIHCFNNIKWKTILADILALVLNLRDGYISVSKILSAVLQVYSIDSRLRDAFKAQTMSSELLTMLGIAGMPKQLIEAVKSFTALTGKRIFDSSFIMQCFASLITIIKHLLHYVAEQEKKIAGTNITSFIEKFVDFIGSSAIQYDRIDKVIKMYTTFMKDASVIHDSRVRTNILDLHKECLADRDFLSYISNNGNKDFQVTWKAFCENVVKLCKTYGVSNRMEPVAFVFEGGAGSGKTTLMNSFVEYLSKKDQSVYVHTVPASENGKDFYDDYNNEDVFVMDDVGQQGISQWRTIINFVSTTKFPLDCARAENKNTKSFNSSLILATTNHFTDLNGFTKADCISEPEALFRRPHVIKVGSSKDENGHFCQHLQYCKYDFRSDNPRWEGGFLEPCLGSPMPSYLDTSTIPLSKRKVAALSWLSQIVEHIRKSTAQDNVRSMISEEEVDEIDDYSWDAQHGNIISSLSSWMIDPLFAKAGVWKEWCRHQKGKYVELCQSFFSWLGDNIVSLVTQNKIVSKLTDYVSDKCGEIYNLWNSLSEETITLSLALVFAGVCTLVSVYFLYDGDLDTDNIEYFTRACDQAMQKKDEHLWIEQSSGALEVTPNTTRLNALKQHVRMIVLRSDEGEHADTFTQAIVSGDKILVPAHAWPSEAQVDVYTSVDAYRNKCKEREDVKVRCVRMFPGCDLAVFQMERLVARYKNCNNLFLEAKVKNPVLYLVNSYTTIPVMLGVSCVNNGVAVKYSSYLHGPNTGFFHPLTAGGACGTVLFSEDHGIVGFHVAGGSEVGFCVVPPRVVAEEIRSLMLHHEDVPYEFDNQVRENFSGARLRYPEGYVKPATVLAATSLVPTIFNIKINEDVQNLKTIIKDDRCLAPVEMDEIRDKAPPRFDAAGTPHKQIKATSKKSCKLQGRITQAELSFIANCIDDMIPEFDDITDEECAFGNKDLPALNKDSSNGYGCERGKDKYFDFTNKVIYDHTLDKFDKFKQDIENGSVDIRDVLSVESFKDELRTEDKLDSPRTFRVMPLQHIWWSKKIFGSTMSHFKENRHKTGMCVGFNPFQDCDVLAQKLRDCEVTGDIDFSKWDGSIMSSFMYVIGDAFARKYKGKYPKVLEYLISSSATSCVLVNDELIATTHGLPSGTWLTLVMNSLINKCLTALTLYRYDNDPTLEKFYRVVDYVMGDDKIIGATKYDKHWFNLKTIEAVASSLGMTCTNGDKTPITKMHQPFDKLTFVKRHFRYHPVLKRYVGCLSVETLLGTIQWMDSSKDIEDVLPGKIRSVLVEAYLHSPALYKAFKDIFNKYRPGDSMGEQKVISILSDERGYIDVLKDMGKDFHYLE